MLAKLIVAVVVEALDGDALDRAVHPLNLTIPPGMVRLPETVPDVAVGAGALEGVAAEQHLLGASLGSKPASKCCGGPQEVVGDPACTLLVPFEKGELRGPVDRYDTERRPSCVCTSAISMRR